MASGTVKWFNLAKGYGFIRPSDGTGDVFVALAAVRAAGLSGLEPGQALGYDRVIERGQATAANLKPG